MANINQGPAGSVEQYDGEAFLVHEESNVVDGERRSVEVFSDGSRKHYVNGELQFDQTVFTDEEKANGDAEALEPPAPRSDLTAGDKAVITANGGVVNPDAVSPPLVGGVDGDDDQDDNDDEDEDDEDVDVNDGVQVPESDLTDSQVAEIVALHGAGASGELNEFGPQEPTLVPDGDGGVELEVHEERPEGDLPVFAHTPPETEQLAGVPTVEENPETPEDRGEEAAEEAEDAPGAVSDTPGEDVEGDTEVSDGLDEKTVATLRDQAKDENINLHGATTKDDIIAAIRKGDKNDA